jgi:hypothetical protein
VTIAAAGVIGCQSRVSEGKAEKIMGMESEAAVGYKVWRWLCQVVMGISLIIKVTCNLCDLLLGVCGTVRLCYRSFNQSWPGTLVIISIFLLWLHKAGLVRVPLKKTIHKRYIYLQICTNS